MGEPQFGVVSKTGLLQGRSSRLERSPALIENPEEPTLSESAHSPQPFARRHEVEPARRGYAEHMIAELLSVGTELLLGEIVDTNSAFLASDLGRRGVDI